MAKRRVRPRPVAKNSQRTAKVPNAADQRDLTTDKDSSAKTSKLARKFFFFFAVFEHKLVSLRSQQ